MKLNDLREARALKVTEARALVDKAGATMTDIVSAIRRVTDLMAEISAASQEQSQGVAQVGEAVTQMDQTTQQNAALVEESAAAAGALRKQAQDLVQAVAVFQLPASVQHDQAGRVVSPAPASVVMPSQPLRAPAARRSITKPVAVQAAPHSLMGGVSADSTDMRNARSTRKSTVNEDDWETF